MNPVSFPRPARLARALPLLVLLAFVPAPAHAGRAAPPGRVPPVDAAVKKNLETFDELDFVVFTGQKWDRLRESHARDIVVHWPDGRTTRGIDTHIEDLRAMFVYAPDTRIETHPIKFGSGEWTAVVGVMDGTFTKPMPIGEGRTLAPTGKAFHLEMCTVGHWKNGVMDEEYLFWDNQAFMKQIGLAP